MAITKTYSSVDPEVITADGTALVTLGLSAQPGNILTEPTDIVIVLESTLMLDGGLEDQMRMGARNLVERVASATGSSYLNPLGNGVRIALVVYNTQAVTSVGLTDDTVQLDAGITSVSSRDEGVNHATALETAAGLLEGSTSHKAILMFAYSPATAGGDGKAAADAAKAQGIQIFGLGPEIRRADLTRWVSAPDDFYLCINVGGESMAVPFDMAGDCLTAPHSKNVTLNSSVSTDFEILRVVSTSHGSAEITDPQELVWSVGELGRTGPVTAEIIYEIRHIGTPLGKKSVTTNNLLTADYERDRIIPNPELFVIADCGRDGIYVPEGCSNPVEILVPGCTDAVSANLGAVGLASLGRVVQVDFMLKGVCPGKRVAVTLILEELDCQGITHPRGVKHLLIPARTGTACEDVEIKCVEFSVPEVLDPSGHIGSICNTRTFQARAIANYVDTDFYCCDTTAQPI